MLRITADSNPEHALASRLNPEVIHIVTNDPTIRANGHADLSKIDR